MIQRAIEDKDVGVAAVLWAWLLLGARQCCRFSLPFATFSLASLLLKNHFLSKSVTEAGMSVCSSTFSGSEDMDELESVR